MEIMGEYHVKSNNPRMLRQANRNSQDEDDYETFQYAKEKDEDPPEDSNLT